MTLDVESQIPVEQDAPELFLGTVKMTRTADAMEDDDRVDCDCGAMVIRDF